jgi:hypothetical protein
MQERAGVNAPRHRSMPERYGRLRVACGAWVVPQPRFLDLMFIQEKIMLKQQVVSTSLGQLTVSSLTLGELRQLDSLFAESMDGTAKGLAWLLKYLPVISNSLRKVHQDFSLDRLEDGLTLEDFNALFSAVLEVSGLMKSTPGEAIPVPV